MNQNEAPSLKERFHPARLWMAIRNRFRVVCLVFAVCAGTVAAVTFLKPVDYLGRVTLEIEAADSKVAKEAIRSQEAFDTVIRALDLTSVWELENISLAGDRLDRAVAVRSVDGGLEITVRDKDGQLATRIGRLLAESYIAERNRELASRARDQLALIEGQIAGQEKKVEAARKEMYQLMKQSGVGQRILDSLENQETSPTERVIQSSEEALFDAKQEVEKIASKIKSLEGLELEEFLKQATSLDLGDATMQSLLPKYYEAQLQLRELEDSGLGRKHPRVAAVRNRLNETARMLENSAESIRQSLDTQQRLAGERYQQLRDLRTRKAERSGDERAADVEYVAAKRQHDVQVDLLTQMMERLNEKRVELMEAQAAPRLHEARPERMAPLRANLIRTLVAGAGLSLLAAIGAALVLEGMDSSIKNVEDIEKSLGLSVLTVVPKGVGVLHHNAELPPEAEAYRILRTNLEYNRATPSANVISVVSASPGEGKSTTLMNLSTICAQGGQKTLLVDADLRRPRLHELFGIGNETGLTDFLEDEARLEDVVLTTPFPGLYFLPSGQLPADSAGALGSRRMRELIAEAKKRFDLVLVDSPPILGVSDASIIAHEVDATMVVVQHRRLPRKILRRVKQSVETAGGTLAGVVLNQVDIKSDHQFQYYTTYYTYHSKERKPAQPSPPAENPEPESETHDEFIYLEPALKGA